MSNVKVRAYLRLGKKGKGECDVLILYLHPEECLAELKVLCRALDPLFVSLGVVDCSRGYDTYHSFWSLRRKEFESPFVSPE